MATGRATPVAVTDAYNHLFESGLSKSRIKDSALAGRLFPESKGATGVAGRSLAWKIFLSPREPLPVTDELPPRPPIARFKAARKQFTDLLMEEMRAPDGSYEEGFAPPGINTLQRNSRKASNLETNNPLSLHDENPWTAWFAAAELRKTIRQDVERTFPEIEFYRDPQVQSRLTEILFLHSVLHPDIGYRQGMHELLASLFSAVDYDSLPDGNSPVEELCSRTWVAADTWVLFQAVMEGVGPWYEWRETAASARTPHLPSHVQFNIPNGRVDLKPYVAPIVQACLKMQSSFLKSVDPSLWSALQLTGIEPQLYGIRWLRLLFTREFSMPDAMVLWDGLFACDPSFDLAYWICVAMLLRIRNELISSDYTTQLTHLLRYPTPSDPPPEAPHHALILLKQALALQMSPTAATGAAVVMENRNILNIPIEIPDPPPSAPLRRRAQHPKASSTSDQNTSTGTSKTSHGRQPSVQPVMGIPEMIARGLMDRGESLGINKTLMGAVAELRKNIPDLAATLGRTPMSPTMPTSSTFPMMDERPHEERPPWEPRSRFEMEREVNDLRSMNKRIGDRISQIVDILLQDHENADSEQVKTAQRRKREAIESLSYVRDALHGSTTVLDEERLLGEEEMEKRRTEAKKRQHRRSDDRDSPRGSAEHPSPSLPPPKPAASPVPPLDSTSQRPSRSPFSYFPEADQGPKSPRAPATRPIAVAYPSSPPTTNTSTPAMTPNTESVRIAPWNYTRSSFSQNIVPAKSATNAAPTGLPRVPPPTSTALRPAPRASAYPPFQSQAVRREAPHDPLGVS